jgi:hypothetical protein
MPNGPKTMKIFIGKLFYIVCLDFLEVYLNCHNKNFFIFTEKSYKLKN